jgi:hypothetical protein
VETTLLYSGGTDSTLAAILLAERFDRVRLVTYDHRWWTGHFDLRKALARGRRVRERLGPDRITHEFVRMGPLFHRFVTATLLDDYRRFHTNTCCVGCKLAMHTRTVLFNLERGIRYAADGSAADQSYHAEQLGGVLARVRRLYQRYGIEYANPSFSILEADRRAKVEVAGLGAKAAQPRCLFGAYDFFIYTPLHVAHHQEEDVMTAYMDYKLPLAFRVIDEEIARRGLRLPGDGREPQINADERR